MEFLGRLYDNLQKNLYLEPSRQGEYSRDIAYVWHH